MSSGFDRLARPYRWMEYLSFGRALETCRFRFLPDLAGAQSALLLGDGDGRFAARLLGTAPLARVHAIDSSSAMLLALQLRCRAAGATDRLTVLCADVTQAGTLTRPGEVFDLLVTHFFLDCLDEEEIDTLVLRLKPLLMPGTRWVISEFGIPPGAVRLPAWLLVRSLYLAFLILTGLRADRLPEYSSILERHGFKRVRRVATHGGILLSEMWILTDS